MIKSGVNLSQVKTAIEKMYKKPVEVTLNLGRNKYVVFAGTLVECMKKGGRGAKGHIAVATDSVSRAVYQLENEGYEFDESTFKYDANGRMTVAYFKNEIAGFAIHLVLRK